MKTNDAFVGQHAPATTAGFYLRNNLSATGASPGQSPFNLCPDIMQSDTSIANPAITFSSIQSWQQSYDIAPVMNANNYYYMRSMNGAQQSGTGNAALYWAPAQVFNFPDAWKGNRLGTAGHDWTVPLEAASEQIAVTATPFLWNPPALPDGTAYFNLVGQIQSGTASLPAVTSWLDLAALIANPNFGFRNQAMVDGSDSWTQRQRIAVPASFPTASLQFTLFANGFKGATVGVLCDTFTPSGEVLDILPTVVAGDGMVTGKSFSMEPGYTASLAVSCRPASGTSLAPGASLTLLVTYPIAAGQELDLATRHGVLRHLGVGENASVGPQPVAIVATLTFTVDGAAG